MKQMEQKKQIAYDVLIDIISGIAIGVGVYNFAAEANFPLAGISGIALIFYQLYRIPIGMMTVLLNVPIAILCFRTLGGRFFFRSVKTLLITSLIVDYVAPLFPVYTGDRMLSAVCCGIFTGIGYAPVSYTHLDVYKRQALCSIAEKAMEKDTGARALRAIIEEFMLDIMYEIPKDDSIGQVTITRDYIEGKGCLLYTSLHHQISGNERRLHVKRKRCSQRDLYV